MSKITSPPTSANGDSVSMSKRAAEPLADGNGMASPLAVLEDLRRRQADTEADVEGVDIQ